MPVFYPQASETYVRKSPSILRPCILNFFFTVGAIIVGRISDRVVIKWREKRQGVWFPEDRLRASLIPFAITIPISVLAFGLINQFVDGKLGLGLSLVCLFFTGLGVGATLDRCFRRTNFFLKKKQVEMSFGPCKAYLVDVMHSRSAEILAANRSVLY